jgi:hypothetical protein
MTEKERIGWESANVVLSGKENGMRLEIRRRGVKVTAELRAYLKKRVRLGLSRFGRHIGLVRIYLRGLRGPRGGVGKTCRIVVELPPRGRAVVTGVDAEIRDAITGAANRAGVAVKRHVKRRRAGRRPSRRPAHRVLLAAPREQPRLGAPPIPQTVR